MASTVSWREMVQVNGSFYCNLSTDVEAEDDEECDSGAVTVLQVGTPSTPTSRSASVTAAPEHTIKLVIGAAEPVSLDTSEYVSWDGDNEDQLSEGDTDQLTDACRRFFDRRQKTLKARWTQQPTATLQHQMAHLRREIASLVNQDDALFRQLLALSSSIRDLRAQQQLNNFGDLPDLRDLHELSDLHDQQPELRTSMAPSGAAPSPPASSSGAGSSAGSSGGSDDDVDHLHQPQHLHHHHHHHHHREPALTRKKISYPPTSRNRILIADTPVLAPTMPTIQQTRPFKSPRSPHSSFYRGTGAYRPHLPPPPPPPTSMSVSSTSTSLLYPTMAHKRQGSYDSGIQGSEPSDGEVFV